MGIIIGIIFIMVGITGAFGCFCRRYLRKTEWFKDAEEFMEEFESYQELFDLAMAGNVNGIFWWFVWEKSFEFICCLLKNEKSFDELAEEMAVKIEKEKADHQNVELVTQNKVDRDEAVQAEDVEIDENIEMFCYNENIDFHDSMNSQNREATNCYCLRVIYLN